MPEHISTKMRPLTVIWILIKEVKVGPSNKKDMVKTKCPTTLNLKNINPKLVKGDFHLQVAINQNFRFPGKKLTLILIVVITKKYPFNRTNKTLLSLLTDFLTNSLQL